MCIRDRYQRRVRALESFAHGANDTANAIGPFAAVWFFWKDGYVSKEPIPVWALAMGGGAIVIGLATFGSRVMQTIGKKITKVNFTRGFSIEFSSAFSVVVASALGMPISTTHCQVGAVVGVGLVSKNEADKNEVNFKLFAGIVISWFITVPLAAVISGVLCWGLRPTVRT
eukprot:TRINITY_DN2076_c0_g1_i1.p1 TRINITY_DN2076_c0_g1~~TRINITY_DN2076_c0_g1_i1.p1  ORF type:complete len:171 (+),score=38.19 TRINITY_DN2076_c0_g1_i1:3-515(+)